MIHPGLAALEKWDTIEYAAGYWARLAAIPDSEIAHHCWRCGWEAERSSPMVPQVDRADHGIYAQVSNQTYLIYASCGERGCSSLFSFWRSTVADGRLGKLMQDFSSNPCLCYSYRRFYKRK